MLNGIFITFEGPEGSGKTSVIKGVTEQLLKENYEILTTREPGGIRISEKIRDIILDVEHKEMTARTEALLYAASRSQHYEEKIKPALEAGKIILCDRFIDSSLAYQGYAREIGVEEVFEINRFGIGNNLPVLTIFIDVPPQVGLNRVFSNTRKVDRLDLESLAFHEKVYEGYMQLKDRFPKRIKFIDGQNPLEKVIEDTLKVIKEIL
ncbi:dTMP kinase [Candidatus Izimaplasma bacterium ZiA1]|nr:dTMP kinase [Candidatus Izimaplasma bacterium ZiA1]